jgi:hypothetical protein
VPPVLVVPPEAPVPPALAIPPEEVVPPVLAVPPEALVPPAPSFSVEAPDKQADTPMTRVMERTTRLVDRDCIMGLPLPALGQAFRVDWA